MAEGMVKEGWIFTGSGWLEPGTSRAEAKRRAPGDKEYITRVEDLPKLSPWEQTRMLAREVPEPVVPSAIKQPDVESLAEELLSLGRTPDTESRLRELGATEADISEFYATPKLPEAKYQPSPLREVFARVFPAEEDIEVEDIQAWLRLMQTSEQAQDDFLDSMQEIGRTPDTEDLLRGLGATEGQMAELFEPITIRAEGIVVAPEEVAQVEELAGRLGFTPAPPPASPEERERRIRVFRDYRERGGKLSFDQWGLMGMPSDISVKLPSMADRKAVYAEEAANRQSVYRVIGEGILKLPRQIAATILQAFQGQGGASVVDPDWADRFISDANRDLTEFEIEMVDKYGEQLSKSGLPFSVTDLTQLPRNIAYSITSMGAGLATGIPIAFAPVPGARVAAWGVGSAASGAVAYSMTTYQIMQQYLELKNEDQITKTGRGITAEEEEQLKADFEDKAREYGLWEAVPEAISNLAFGKILTTPLTGMVGKNIATRLISKLAALYGEEMLTETITQMGQSAIEVEAGLREKRISWVEAFKEVAPQTFLLTTILGGVGAVSISTVSRIKSSLKREIGETHPLYKDIEPNINEDVFDELAQNEEIDAESLKERVSEIVPPVKPEVPIKPKAVYGEAPTGPYAKLLREVDEILKRTEKVAEKPGVASVRAQAIDKGITAYETKVISRRELEDLLELVDPERF